MLKPIKLLHINLLVDDRDLVVGLECFSNIICLINEIEDERILLARMRSVQSGKCLDGLYAVEALIHIHGV